MPLFCKQCDERRVPIFQKEENTSFWLCEKCGNFCDQTDNIIRELTELEKKELKEEVENFENDTAKLPQEKMTRRKGVN